MVSFLVATVALLSATASAATLRRQALPCGANGTVSHTIASGETLETIATRYSSGICDIASFNQIANANVIEAGATINVPTFCSTPDSTSCVAPVPTATCVFGVGSSYVVQSGDSLNAIAGDFNITLASVIAANSDIANPDLIQVSQVINIPVCPNSCCDWVGTYNIKSGDTFTALAKTYGTTVGQIKALNSRVDPSNIAIDQQIILPQNCRD
ncbi:hypothetical protein J1614_010435 [Plenodomus biglobosus]|nr:hypothetical protein J1614_010435 [Plenodomus biglobosus]